MTNEPITDLDILAYADGRLERDPARRRMVEQELAKNSEMAAQVAAYRAQDESIREAFPLPPDNEWVRIPAPSRPAGRTAWRHAATVALMLASGGAGWMAATSSETANPHLSAFMEGASLSEPQPVSAPAVDGAREAPLLTDAGYALVETKPISRNGMRVEQFTFRNEMGRVVRVFRQRRDPATMPAIPVVERDGEALAVWEEGPYAYGLLTSEEPAVARNLAEIARRNIRKLGTEHLMVTDNGVASPAVQPQVTSGDPVPQATQPAVGRALPPLSTDG